LAGVVVQTFKLVWQCSASGGGIFFLAWLLGRDRRAFSTVRGLQKDFNFFAYQGVRRVVSNLVCWLLLPARVIID
jgi:hypothetical protein